MAYGIPNVGLPMDSLDKGFTNLNDLFNRLREHALKQQQMVNDAKYRGESLKISRQQQDRLGQLLGPQLQELADKHRKSQPGFKAEDYLAIREKLRAMGMPGAQGGMNPRANPATSNVSMNPNDQNQMPNDPNTGILNGDHDTSYMGDVGGADGAPMDNSGTPMSGGQQQSMYNPNDPIDQMAAKLSGMAPGMQHESPQERESREIRTNEAKLNQKTSMEEEKENRKVTQKIEDDVKPILAAAHHLQEIEKLLLKHPNATGKLKNAAAGSSLFSDFVDSATIRGINAHAVPLQGKLAREIGNQGGARAAAIAQGAKPHGGESYEGNVGLVQANKDAVLDYLKDAKKDYERRNPGKEFPYKIPKFLMNDPFSKSNEKHPDQMVTVNHNGHKTKMTRAEAERYIEAHKNG